MAEDFYNILGVQRTATQDEIKRAYRTLAHKYHPDKSGGDEEKFKQVNAAYQVLGDQKKRAHYDQFGQTFDGSSGAGAPFSGFNVNFEDLGGIGDIFEQFFGGTRGGRGGRAVRRGDDIAVDVTISFIESARGGTKDISLRLWQACAQCKGSGAEPGTPIRECSTCRGEGSVVSSRQTMFGAFATRTVCHTCEGEGKQAQTPCRHCRGQGREKLLKSLSLEIPAGIADGQTIRVNGKGEVPIRGGVPGDLYVTIHVAPHQVLARDGDDVRTQATISFVEAALGTVVAVPTLTGEEAVEIASGTQPMKEIRLRGKGFPSLSGGGHGDEIITVQVAIPTKLNRQQRKLLEEFRGAKKKGLLF